MELVEIVFHGDIDLSIDDPLLSIHEALAQGVGRELWESPPYRRLRDLVVKYANSTNILKNLQAYPGLSLNAILALVYYTSDVRRFHGKKTDNVFALINEAINSREPDAIGQWDAFVFLSL
jgi:hypothetical protein